MRVQTIIAHTLRGVRIAALSLAALQMSVGPVLAAVATPPPGDIPSPGTLGKPVSPIKHVIVIIGENRSFDHVFATYQPQPGQKVHNLLSEGIVKLDADKNAIAGPNFAKAQQLAATDTGPADTFLLSPPKQEFPHDILHQRDLHRCTRSGRLCRGDRRDVRDWPAGRLGPGFRGCRQPHLLPVAGGRRYRPEVPCPG
jgi:hypothetical protein